MEPVPSSRRVLVWRGRLSKEIVRQGIGAPTRNGAAGGGLGVDVLSPVIVGKAPGLSQLNRNTIWLFQSTQVPGSPQRASWPFRLNALTCFLPDSVEARREAGIEGIRLTPGRDARDVCSASEQRWRTILARFSSTTSSLNEIVSTAWRRSACLDDPPMSRSYAG